MRLENEWKVSFTSCLITSQFHIISCVHVASLILGPLTVLCLFYSFNIQVPVAVNLLPRQDYINTKYILTWCEGYGDYKYGWDFGENKFRSVCIFRMKLFKSCLKFWYLIFVFALACACANNTFHQHTQSVFKLIQISKGPNPMVLYWTALLN